MNNVILTGVAALIVSLVALVVAVWRSAALPAYESREEALSRRVADLESTVKTLQTMLYDKQREVIELTERIRQLEHSAVAAPATERPAHRQRKPILAVGIGTDRMLEADLAVLRGVPEVQLMALHDVSMRSLETLLERQRAKGSPVRYLHLAVHAGPQGVLFSDGIADGLWLSQHLSGVEIMVIAGCESAEVSDLLSVVTYPISMRDKIDNRDATIFARAFWTEIGRGATADDALGEALRRSPSAVAEMVEAHW